MNLIDIFAGAGGLSEGFIRGGFTPLAHIEMDKYILQPRFLSFEFYKI
ncbi:MAG: DNA cytosine methyltransferase [Campylobacteraceae bacterium]|jgi:DNA (cytosine-5)-methyltransferase 1|nr:DNA cytosine methyltransferase [Campylobacteraceae bacterium]